MRLRSRHDQSLSHGSPNAVTSFPPLRTPPLSISLTSPRPFHRRSFRFPDSCAFVTSSISGLPIPKSARQRFPVCVFFSRFCFSCALYPLPFSSFFWRVPIIENLCVALHPTRYRQLVETYPRLLDIISESPRTLRNCIQVSLALLRL